MSEASCFGDETGNAERNISGYPHEDMKAACAHHRVILEYTAR